MRLSFIRALINRGFIECAYCGKAVRVEQSINNLCVNCSKKRD